MKKKFIVLTEKGFYLDYVTERFVKDPKSAHKFHSREGAESILRTLINYGHILNGEIIEKE